MDLGLSTFGCWIGGWLMNIEEIYIEKHNSRHIPDIALFGQ